MSEQKYCRYCKQTKPATGFVSVKTKTGLRKVGYKCLNCLAASKLSVSERDQREAKRKDSRKHAPKQASKILTADQKRINKLKAAEGF